MVMTIFKFTAYDYVPSGLETGKSLRQGFKGSNRRFTRKYETIQLPMQPQLSESTAVSWGGDTLNAAQAAGARAAFESIESFTEKGGGLQGAINALGDGLNDLVGLAKDDRTKQAISAYFAGQAVGANVLGRYYRSSHQS